MVVSIKSFKAWKIKNIYVCQIITYNIIKGYKVVEEILF